MENVSSNKNNQQDSCVNLLKILFVNVIDLENAIHKRYHPLAFGYLTSYCSKYGGEFEPCYVEKLNEALLRTFQPDVVALTSITENYCLAQSYADLVKHTNSKIKVVVGRAHISSVPLFSCLTTISLSVFPER